jgi:hypothetical protein
MSYLTVQQITWCMHHARPIVALRSLGGETCFWITLSPEDANALSKQPWPHPPGNVRVFQLLEELMHWAGVDLSEVRLRLSDDVMSLEGEARFCQGSRTLRLPLPLNDAIILAWRAERPLSIDERSLDFIQAVVGVEPSPVERTETPHAPDANPFLAFIETLDLDRLDSPNR